MVPAWSDLLCFCLIQISSNTKKSKSLVLGSGESYSPSEIGSCLFFHFFIASKKDQNSLPQEKIEISVGGNATFLIQYNNGSTSC